MDAPVLIIGAGPTGLTLACTLARRGLHVRVVDAASAAPMGSRGKGLQPRTLEMFDDLGITDVVLAHGVIGYLRTISPSSAVATSALAGSV